MNTCASCRHFRAHKLRNDIAACRLMRPIVRAGASQPPLISPSMPCYFKPSKWEARA